MRNLSIVAETDLSLFTEKEILRLFFPTPEILSPLTIIAINFDSKQAKILYQSLATLVSSGKVDLKQITFTQRIAVDALEELNLPLEKSIIYKEASIKEREIFSPFRHFSAIELAKTARVHFICFVGSNKTHRILAAP